MNRKNLKKVNTLVLEKGNTFIYFLAALVASLSAVYLYFIFSFFSMGYAMDDAKETRNIILVKNASFESEYILERDKMARNGFGDSGLVKVTNITYIDSSLSKFVYKN